MKCANQATEQDLIRMEYYDTSQRLGNNQIWQSRNEIIVWNPEDEVIVARYKRNRC